MFRGGIEPSDSPEKSAAQEQLIKAYGPLEYESPLMPFNYTRYYQKEMGPNIWRRIISFQKLVPRDQLPDIKCFCMDLEKQFLDDQGNRLVNLDPGLLTTENLILATGKNFSHRIYLRQGVFAEITLYYHNQRFNRLPWTYPDYGSEEFCALFTGMRKRLLEALNAQKELPDSAGANADAKQPS
jgi:hypothetical protein